MMLSVASLQEMVPALGTLQRDKTLMTMLNIFHPGIDVSSQARFARLPSIPQTASDLQA